MRSEKENSRKDGLKPIGSETKSEKVTITLAIDKDILESIRADAESEGLSINSSVNTILYKWTSFFKYFRENQVITLTSQNFEEILAIVPEQTFVNQWRQNAINIVPMLFAEKKIPMTVDNLIEHEYKTFGVLGGAYKNVSAHRDPDGHTLIVFTHRYGIKWSKIIAAVYSEQLTTYLKCHVNSSISPTSCTLRILEKDVGVTKDP